LRLSISTSGCCGRPGAGIGEWNWCEVEVDAPFRLCNACPAEIYCELHWLRQPWAPRQLCEETDHCSAKKMLHVMDGFGGVWDVPEGGVVMVAPIRLDEDGCFHWWVAGEKRQRSRPRSRGVDVLRVLRRPESRGTVLWRCCQAARGGAGGGSGRLRVAPGEECPVFELPPGLDGTGTARGLVQAQLPPLLLAVALRDERSGCLCWSVVVPAAAPAVSAEEISLDLGCGTRVHVARQADRTRAVVFAPCWFNDATGLGVAVTKGGPCGSHIPVFCDIGILDSEDLVDVQGSEKAESDAGEHSSTSKRSLGLRPPGTKQSVPLPVVGQGQSVKLSLSTLHPCVLKAEPIAVGSTFGVRCTRLSLIPALLAFNQLEACELGLRQEGCHAVTWIPPRCSSPIFWSTSQKPQRLCVAVRPQGSNSVPDVGFWSPSVAVTEKGVGAFPLVLMETDSARRLLCLQVNQCSSQILTVTASGESECHQLVNRHPCLVLDACYEGEDSSIECASHFVVPFGEQVALGRSTRGSKNCFQDGGALLLLIGDVTCMDCCKQVRVRLDRADSFQLKASSAFPVAVAIRVELRERVARVLVSPVSVGLGGGGDASSKASGAERHGSEAGEDVTWALEIDLRMPSLTVSLVGEQPSRAEVFGIHLAGIAVACNQSADGRRETLCELGSLQVDFWLPEAGGRSGRSPKRSRRSAAVVLASLGSRVLRLRLLRENLASCDVVLRELSLDFLGSEVNMELCVSEALLAAVRRLQQEATPPQLEGPCLQEALGCAGLPHHLVLVGPPLPARKYVLHAVEVSGLKLAVWCSLSVGSLPQMVGALLSLSSLSPTLEVDGARVKLPQQQFFQGRAPFEGTLEALSSIVMKRYSACISASWKSVLNNSNAILGGLLSRHAWAPRKRTVTEARASVLRLTDGVVDVSSPTPMPKKHSSSLSKADSGQLEIKASEPVAPMVGQAAAANLVGQSNASGSTSDRGKEDLGKSASLDELGFQTVSASGNFSELQEFLGRLIAALGGEVPDRASLSSFVASLTPEDLRSLDDVVQRLLCR
ncbi:unnamed protein product, partial [Polarella glacialis]